MPTFGAGTSHRPDRRELAARAANSFGAAAILATYERAPVRSGFQSREVI